MKTTSMDIEEQLIRKKLFGYDKQEVELLREMASKAISDGAMEINTLKREKLRLETRLAEHERTEKTLKDTVTTAHKMYEDLKGSAGREAELIVAEARQRADELLSRANERLAELHNEISGYKRQRIELEASIKAVIDYHGNILELTEEDAKRADGELEKLRLFPR